MSVRRPILAVLATAVVLAGCSGATASALPSVAIPSIPASIGTVDLQGFCEDFAGAISSDWPNIDQTTATELSTIVAEWSTSPELETIRGDVETIGTWLASQATATAVATPPPDVETAFQNVTTFADANC